MDEKQPDEFQVPGKELLDTVKRIVKEGNARKVIIKNGQGQTYLEVPVTVGLVGVLLAPVLAALGALAALATDFTIQVQRGDETSESPEDPKQEKPA